jgi:hypothetical protein
MSRLRVQMNDATIFDIIVLHRYSTDHPDMHLSDFLIFAHWRYPRCQIVPYCILDEYLSIIRASMTCV